MDTFSAKVPSRCQTAARGTRNGPMDHPMPTTPTALLRPDRSINFRARTLSNRFLREAVGGWQLNTITTFESGSPVTVFNGYTSSFDYMGDVPDQTCNGNLSRADRTFTHGFNTDWFKEPAPDPIGESYLIGVTSGVIRSAILESTTGTCRLENRSRFLRRPGTDFPRRAFNVFNHTQWSSVATTGIGCACVIDDRQSNPDSSPGSLRGPAWTAHANCS